LLLSKVVFMNRGLSSAYISIYISCEEFYGQLRNISCFLKINFFSNTSSSYLSRAKG
jgi:hypothetical protein